MSVNRYEKHVFIIPEDDEERQIANGLTLHWKIDPRRVQVLPVAGGWHQVLETFKLEYKSLLLNNAKAHVVMLIDFDNKFDSRRKMFEDEIPTPLRDRVFVVGPLDEPKDLKKQFGQTLERIGSSLADDCVGNTTLVWGHEHFKHNEPDRLRLLEVVKGFLFKPDLVSQSHG